MKPDYSLCDRCGGKAPERGLCVIVDRVMGPAGSMDNVGEMIDLCAKCSQDAIKMMIDGDYVLAKKIVKFARKQ